MNILKNSVAVSCAALLLVGSGICPYNYVDFSIPIVANAEVKTIDLSTLSSDYTISDSDEYIITGTTTEYRIIVTGSPTITLSDVNMDFSAEEGKTVETAFTPIDFSSANGMCNVILKGTNFLRASQEQAAGIRVGTNGVTFNGDGSLEVHGGAQWPGIGNSDEKFYIKIDGGNITAYGGENAAGIGGGQKSAWFRDASYTITIKGGTINAYGGNYGAGIGSGYIGNGGKITIFDGEIIAKGGSGAEDIGSGAEGIWNNNHITGGTINGVNYNFTEPSYTVTIPANINLQVGSSTSADVKVENVCIPNGNAVHVKLSGAYPTPNGDKFHIQSGGNTLDYKISKGSSGSAISLNSENSEILSVMAGTKESTETLTFVPSDYKYSGTYKGTITFTVSVS